MTNQQFRPGGFRILPPVVKNLLIINGLFFLATISLQSGFKIDLNTSWGLYYIGSEQFRPFQFLTYMFLHGDITHLFFNMFAFWMFGNAIENYWGPKRFLIYYFATGIGAAIVQMLVSYIRYSLVKDSIPEEALNDIIYNGYGYLQEHKNFVDPVLAKVNLIFNAPTVGASGSVFGILLAFGMLFPNALIYLYFAIPIRAKWLVIGYGALELWSGLAASPGDNVAHFAHLGGMIFGFILIKIWKKKDINNRWT
jgi:membrane associated rhomboid family serine protease